jgi:hypothetical protein
MGVGHTTSLLTRAAFDAVGGYPAISLGVDAAMDQALLAKMERVVDPQRGARPLAKSEWFYVYRWGVSPVHLSGRADGGFYREIGTRPIQPGRFDLHPHWRRDYEEETRALLNAYVRAGMFGRSAPPPPNHPEGPRG